MQLCAQCLEVLQPARLFDSINNWITIRRGDWYYSILSSNSFFRCYLNAHRTGVLWARCQILLPSLPHLFSTNLNWASTLCLQRSKYHHKPVACTHIQWHQNHTEDVELCARTQLLTLLCLFILKGLIPVLRKDNNDVGGKCYYCLLYGSSM